MECILAIWAFGLFMVPIIVLFGALFLDRGPSDIAEAFTPRQLVASWLFWPIALVWWLLQGLWTK